MLSLAFSLLKVPDSLTTMSLETESKSAKDSELKFTQKKNIININEQKQKQIQIAVSVKLLL
jgi:hypothetical protein